MNFIQEAVELTAGINFAPQRLRYRIPNQKNDVSIYLLSDSYEYDIQLIKSIPSPKMEYRNIIIPRLIIDKVGQRLFRYNVSQKEYSKRIQFLNEQKMIPQVLPVKFPTPVGLKDNVYVAMSDLVKMITPNLRQCATYYLQDNIFNIFEKVMKFGKISSRNILIIDTKRYKIYSNPKIDTFHSDLINALLTGYIYSPQDKIKRLNWTIIFRGEDADYKFDLMSFEKRDVQRLRMMLDKVGSPTANTATTDEEAGGSIDDFQVPETTEIELDDEIPDNPVHIDPEVRGILNNSEDVTSSIKSTLNALSAKFGHVDDVESEEENNVYKAKTININATLLNRINPIKINQNAIANYEKISADLSPGNENSPVESKIMDDTAKKMAQDTEATNTQDVMNTTTSPREAQIRKQVGQIKLNNVTFDTLTTITDVPKPKPRIPRNITTTSDAAKVGSSFADVTTEYEEKLLDRDIVSIFMNFSSLPDGFYVTNVEVTDVSTCTTMMNNWKVTLKNKNSDIQQVINIRVPIVRNGRFYNNGIWYNIGKQDFPIPILKINKKTVMITSNYQKITVSRYDTKSLVDLGMIVKVVEAVNDASGKNLYVKHGSSSSINSHFVSTIEYDEFASKWVSFINKKANLEIYFNRMMCEKQYSFVTTNEDEFCCGMLNQVPIIVNTSTGVTRDGRTLTDIMLYSLPENLQEAYKKQKPSKLSMYADITIGVTLPLGVGIAAWEGMTSLLKKSGAKWQYVDKNFQDTHYMTIPFKDKIVAIQNTIQNQLIFNGFYRINTAAYSIADFERPISTTNSVFIDIFNQYFFKQYSQLTTFITYYKFFVDPITADVCNHYNIPNDISSMLIYAAKLLADNNHTSENNAALYRIRSTEIIPAIIHYRLAFAISKYNNATGSKSRNNKIVFNPNEVMNELLNVPNVEPISALNPMVELHMRENITKKGFKGVNSERSYTLQKRAYEDSMIGKCAISSPNSGNVGVVRQMVADPKITSVRGYTSTDGVDADYNDLQLASFSELMTPGTVARDDAIRTAIATSQTSHIISTDDAQPVLISNGVDEIVPSYLTGEFSFVAKEDGKVLDLNEDYMIIQYKSGKKQAVHIGHTQSFNSGSGFYVDNELTPNAKPGDSFKEGDILAYHKKYFNKDCDGIVRLNVGPLAKIAFMGCYCTYEDAGLMTHKLSKRLKTNLSMMQMSKLSAMDDVESIVKPGDEVEVGDPLIVFGVGDTGDKAVDNFLKAFQTNDGSNSILDNAKRVIKAKHAGTVTDVRMYTCKSMDKLSPSLYKIFDEYFKKNIQRRKILDKYDKNESVTKLGTLYTLPTEPLKGGTIKGITCDVLIEIYISHDDDVSVGDKIVLYGANKQITAEVVPEGQEPYSEMRPDEEISVFSPPSTILKRMIPSLIISASGNKVLIELKRKIKDIWEEK